MKRFPFLLFFLIPSFLSAQITLTQADVPAPGDTISYGLDTTVTELNIGMAGPDRIWDFSQLQVEDRFQFIAKDTAMDADVKNYPGTNLIVEADQVKTFLESTDTAIYILGGGIAEAADFGLEVVRFDPPQKLYSFPIAYGTGFTNFYSADVTVDGSLILPGVDSFRVVRRANATVEVDGYGIVRTPFNSYEALRQRTETFNLDSVYAYFFGAWSPFLVDSSRVTQYQWLAAESKGNVVTVTIDPETGIASEAQFFLDIENANAPLAAFAYTDQGEGAFAFEDQSSNSPTSWLWTFGDGGTSEEQNPLHTYSEDGEYQVCLTAGNFIGSNQNCQTIIVDVLNNTLDPQQRFALRVHPNPADHQIFIRPEGPGAAPWILELYNSQGQCVRRENFSGQLQLEVVDLPAGAYSFLLRSANRQKPQWSSGKLQISH